MKKLFRSAGARMILGGGVLATLVVAGCGDDPVVVNPVTAMDKTPATDNQQGVAGTGITQSPEVTLTRASGERAAGETVTFSVESGGGSVVGAVAVTDDRGLARVGDWILGQIAGPNSLKATTSGLEVTFTAFGLAGPASGVIISAGVEQSAQVNTEVAIPPAVRVTDQFGNGVQGVTVQFTVVSGGGSIIGNNLALSEPDGLAQVGGWRLGFLPGENILEAAVQGFPTLQFTATATP